MSVINYIDPFIGNSWTFAPKESHNRITPWEHMLQKVNSKNEMQKAAFRMVTQKERVSASIVILQQMVSPCGLIAVLPPIFRMVTLFRMVAFIPAHRSEAYALTKKDARRETALLQTLVVHHITSTFAMEQLHGRARLAHKYIHVTISRLQTHLPDLPTHTIHAHAHISMLLRHNYMVVLIQIEHNFFEGQRKTVSTKWKMRLVSDGCTSGL